MRVVTSGGKQIDFEHDEAVCREDYKKGFGLKEHLEEEHDMSVEDYLRRYGKNAPVFGGEVFKRIYGKDIERRGTRSYYESITVGDIEIRAKSGEISKREDRPNGYVYPKQGKAGLAVERVARAVKYNRDIFLYGPAGTGKSDLFRCLAHDLNMEFELYPMSDDLDPALYFGQMQVVIDEDTGQNKTEFVPGRLLRDIQGRVGKDGVRRPVMIAVDDIDRAPASHHEIFRHILDGSKSVFVPEMGTSIPVFPGTRIVATANSRGRGDDFGFYSSVRSMDDSILDRFGRFIEYHYLEVEEETNILKAKFPYLVENAPRAFDIIMKVTESVRRAIKDREVHIGFSHRILVEWCRSIEELVREEGGQFHDKLVGRASHDWLERFDETSRGSILERHLKAYIPANEKAKYGY